jgi:hypothetical protein
MHRTQAPAARPSRSDRQQLPTELWLQAAARATIWNVELGARDCALTCGWVLRQVSPRGQIFVTSGAVRAGGSLCLPPTVQPGLEQHCRGCAVDASPALSLAQALVPEARLSLARRQSLIQQLDPYSGALLQVSSERARSSRSRPFHATQVSREPHHEQLDGFLLGKLGQSFDQLAGVAPVQPRARVCQKAQLVGNRHTNSDSAEIDPSGFHWPTT